jgi:IS30 family transposase
MEHHNHLSISERGEIYRFADREMSNQESATTLGRTFSTICRELKRNTSAFGYSPNQAQQSYASRRKNCGRKEILKDEVIRDKIQALIVDRHWSPEQISSRLKYEKNSIRISAVTIYRVIHKGLFVCEREGRAELRGFKDYLRHEGKTCVKPGTEKRGTIRISHELSERPIEVADRSRIGDWEADTVLGTKGSSILVTLVDRKLHMTLACKVPSLHKGPVADAMIDLLYDLPPGYVKTITPDRSKEFVAHADVIYALNGVQFYFPPPHQPWQRGTNENTNGLLRELSPKGQSKNKLTKKALDKFLYHLNRRPRKCLGWKTPYEVFTGEVLHLI